MTAPRRDSKFYRRAKREFRAECLDKGWTYCWLCSRDIDFEVVGGPDEPDGFSVDHAIPWSVRPDLAYDRGNFRPAHWLCNSDRGSKEPGLGLGDRSRVW